MRSLITFTIYTLMLAAFYQPGAALQCYNCNSINSTTCDHPFSGADNPAEACTLDSATIKSSCAPDSGLMKALDGLLEPGVLETQRSKEGMCMKIFVTAAGLSGVLRTCTALGPATCTLAEKYVEDRGGKVLSCKTCNTDLCNSAVRLSAVLTFLVWPLLLLCK